MEEELVLTQFSMLTCEVVALVLCYGNSSRSNCLTLFLFMNLVQLSVIFSHLMAALLVAWLLLLVSTWHPHYVPASQTMLKIR